MFKECNQDDIIRCPDCRLIPLIQIYYEDSKINICYKCPSGHKGKKELNDFLVKSRNHSIYKNKCDNCSKLSNKLIFKCPNCSKIPLITLIYEETMSYFKYECSCGKEGKLKIDELIEKEKQNEIYKEYNFQSDNLRKMFICSNCNQNQYCLSNDCIKSHFHSYHNIYSIYSFDGMCPFHQNKFVFYCINCNQNYCYYCQLKHNGHQTRNIFDTKFDEGYLNTIKNLINNLQQKVDEMKQKSYNLSEFEFLNNIINSNINLLKILVSNYLFEEKWNNPNYHIVNNINELYFHLQEITNIIEFNKNDTSLNNIQAFIKYRKYFDLNKFNIKNSNYVYKILQLKDGRIGIILNGSYLTLYDKNNFNELLKITEFSIYYFTQLKDERIVCCCNDYTLKIIKINSNNSYNIVEILKGHDNYPYSIIELDNGNLISGGYDYNIIIWENNQIKKKVKIEYKKNESYPYIYSLGKINNNEIVSISYDSRLRFWNTNNLEIISTLEGISCYSQIGDRFLMLNENILAYLYYSCFYLININNHQIIKKISGFSYAYSITRLKDGTILTSNYSSFKETFYGFIQWKFEGNDIKKINEMKKVDIYYIYSMTELDDNSIAIGSYYNGLKILKVNQ